MQPFHMQPLLCFAPFHAFASASAERATHSEKAKGSGVTHSEMKQRSADSNVQRTHSKGVSFFVSLLVCFASPSLCFILCFDLLCFALLCFALLCFALLCFALLCFLLRFSEVEKRRIEPLLCFITPLQSEECKAKKEAKQ
uniref:Transmembrane protein n=1 Tax=Hydrodictyon reticulatum TaxID=3107 RepID=A0A1W5RN10_HYDRE|nr:hypothetical protein [Hydrodictyon reticulatum]AQU64569.1 hypothetical protein [Hydrodictyon reticulatum]